MLFNRTKREKIVKDIQRRMKNYYDSMPAGKGPISHYCLFWAALTMERLREEGSKVRTCMNAGSAFWRRAEPGQISPESEEYGFGFEWNAAAINMIAQASLPEMHVWAVIVNDEPEIIDLTTGFIKKRCVDEGYIWSAEYEPPPFLWCPLNDLPERAFYQADERACKIAYQFWLQSKTKSDFFVLDVS